LYNPIKPVKTYGGHGCCARGKTPAGPRDQRQIQQRADVLVYSSEPLKNDTEVTGAPELQLFFSTDVSDTDFFATLSDVYPDGRAILITEGAIRTRFRDSLETPKLLTPGQTYKVKIRLWETSNVFKKGHRIRLHITSSNFPRFNRNLNSGKPLGEEGESDIRIATQTIYHDREHPSSILLPVIP
jgi:putative CocE/NonD family hydrolase